MQSFGETGEEALQQQKGKPLVITALQNEECGAFKKRRFPHFRKDD
jgi:hypothetical protein